MSIVIAGGGSVGLLIGSFLSEAGMNVTMFVRREEQAQLIRRKGIKRLNADGTKSIVSVNATTHIKKTAGSHLWILATKFSDLPALLAQLEKEKVSSPVLFIQNGIGHLALAYETNLPHIAFATVEHGALRADDRTVSHNGTGMMTIGAGRGDATFFNKIIEARSKNFPVVSHGDGEHVLMRKVMINCMVNPLTAILEVRNGELLTNVYCRQLFEDLYEELMEAYPGMRSFLPLETIVDVCKNTALNHSSMLMDRQLGRPMEIETIVTAVIEKAQGLNKALPLLSTFEKMLYALDRKEKA